MNNPPTQLLPQDLETEQAALGCALIEPGAALIALQHLQPEDFYPEAHQIIFRAMREASRSGPADLVTTGHALRDKDLLERVGGAEYLTALLHTVPTAAHIGRYVDILLDCSRRRQAIKVTGQLLAGLYEGSVTLEDGITRLLAVGEDRHRAPTQDAEAVVRDTAPWQEEYLAADPEPRPPLLGIHEVDRAAGGWETEVIVVFKSQAKFGKTCLLRQAALESARWLRNRHRPERVAVYVLEGSRNSWLLPAYAYLGRVPRRHLRRGGCRQQEGELRERIDAAQAMYAELPILLNTSLFSLDEIIADVLWLQARGIPLCGVFVDYLQCISTGAADPVKQIIQVLDGLVYLRDRTGQPIITGSQVTVKDGEWTTAWGKRIEDKASTVWQLERGPKECKSPDEARRSDVARLICTHARDYQPPATVELYADLDYARFGGAEERPGGPAPRRDWGND